MHRHGHSYSGGSSEEQARTGNNYEEQGLGSIATTIGFLVVSSFYSGKVYELTFTTLKQGKVSLFEDHCLGGR